MADFCSLADCREELLKSNIATIDDNAIQERILRVTALINSYCRQWLDDRTITDEARRGEQVNYSSEGDLTITVSSALVRSVTAASITSDFISWYPLDVTRIDLDSFKVRFVRPRTIPAIGPRIYAKISYVGGYNPTPLDLRQTAARWVAFSYHKREAPFDTTAFPAVGQVTIPASLPGDIEMMLATYIRRMP